MAVLPMPALLVKRTVLYGGSILAELFSKPSFVIFLSLLSTYICSPISAGAYQFISPSQYSELVVLGVPPPTISDTSDNLRCSQVALKKPK